MDPQKLEAVEKLIGYSGLEQRQAKELLERSHWNVDAAYRLHKSAQMEQRGFHRSHPASNRHSDSLVTSRPVATHPRGMFVRPHVDTNMYGTAMMGNGPAVTRTIDQAFLPPQPLPRFPTDLPAERIIPIQVEGRYTGPRLEKQPAVVSHTSMPPPTSVKPSHAPAAPANYPANMSTNATNPRVSGTVVNNPRISGTVINDPRISGTVVNDPRISGTVVNDPRVSGTVVNDPRVSGTVVNTNNPRVSGMVDNTSRVSGHQPAQPVPNKGDTFPKSQQNPVPVKGEYAASTQVKGGKPAQPSAVQPQNPSMQQSGNTEGGSSTPKVLKRGISKISQNAFLVDEERKNVLHDISEDCHDNMYIQTFVLPDVTGYADDFRAFLEKDLIETSTLVSLEQAGRLNWWVELGICQRLLPMATSGDGNCLLHAASLAMWGIHDRQLMLRKALYDTLTKKYYRQALYRRWRWQQTQANKEAGLIFSETEWQAEWDNVLRLASTTPRKLPGTVQKRNSCCDSVITQSNNVSSENSNESEYVVYESLEEFHVFVLAHVIQRPIIVVADTILKDVSGGALAPIPFGGIYMPLECEASHCHRSPLLLTYDAAHFSALVPMDKGNEEEKNGLPVAIPIVSPDLQYLPLHFCIDPGLNFKWDKNNATFSMPDESKLNLLKRYMDLEKLAVYGGFTDSSSDDRNSTGSYESDDGLIDKSKKKDNRVSQQLQSVSKQFGSFGKTMGKKLKNLGKGNKEEKKASGRKLSLTQSTKVPVTISALGDHDQQFVWCCKLTQKKSDTHQKMIDNYLFDAGERFKKDMASRRLRNNEIVSRAQTVNTSNAKVPCVTAGCGAFGTVETSYLCSKCFADQKRQLIDQEKDLLKAHAHNKHNKHHDSADSDVTKIGKSKFYDMKSDSGQVVMEAPVQPKLDLTAANKAQNARMSTVINVTGPRNRSPSPDYDNVDYPFNQQTPSNVVLQHPSVKPQSPKPPAKIFENKAASSGNLCRNPDCDFYGSKDMEGLCSGCYKNKQKLGSQLV